MSHSEWDKNRDFLEGGHIVLCLPIEPVSLQADRDKKNVVTSEIQNITSNFSFILVGDVQIDIEWQIHEQKRYESDSSPDIDNILKPILDALSGLKGVLIDDCQVQAVSCHWIDWDSDEQQITIRIRMFGNDEWLLKDGLIFVHMGKGLCYPIVLKEIDPQCALDILEKLEALIILRQKLLDRNINYYTRKIMSIQRVFHISRLKDFNVRKIADLKAELLDNIQRNQPY
ncbi:RusA family crossover junction endodeoxyribonuclease [Microcoleus sp. N9_B2]|uniref:RusA family crossover junction endodeoxyribonuclease n=1 Tax=unclassified Microcoleus TaxID=2642155 RepID=UPI002FCFE386